MAYAILIDPPSLPSSLKLRRTGKLRRTSQFLATDLTEGIPNAVRHPLREIVRYSFIVLVLLTNRKDYEHFINVRVFEIGI